MNSHPLRIAIVGTGKSGTTALYSRILRSLGEKAVGVFEPNGVDALRRALQDSNGVLAKSVMPLPAGVREVYWQDFDKRVLLTRDPRDVIVSTLLYTSAHDHLWKCDPRLVEKAIGLLKQKEANSAAVSVLGLMAELFDGFDRNAYAAFVNEIIDVYVSLARPEEGYFRFRYEDLIAGDLGDLGQYLGITLHDDPDVLPEFERVTRTKGEGSWRLWFREEDVSYFRPLLKPLMAPFGYDDADWSFRPHALIDAEVSSKYVMRVINDRRRGAGLAPMTLAV